MAVAYVFHHIPKCGGVSVLNAMRQLFDPVVTDYRPDATDAFPLYCKEKKDLSQIPSSGILVSHFEMDGAHLCQRYPELLHDPAVKIFTFVRDPLQLRISLYFYNKKMNEDSSGKTLEESLSAYHNYMARVFPCTAADFKSVLDRYFFIGLQDYLQSSMDVLTTLLKKPQINLPRLNTSSRDKYSLSDDFVQRFKENNALDYRIYDYSRVKFLQKLKQCVRSRT
jgi:hypothetical protein